MFSRISGYLFILFTLLLGSGLVIGPVIFLWNAPSVEAMKAERAFIATWPQTTGHLLYLHRYHHSEGRGLGTYYLEAEYRYEVDGIVYRGRGIGLTWDVYSSTYKNQLIEGFRHDFPPLVVESETATGDKITTFKIADQEVPVYYDAKAPQYSYLDIAHDYSPPSLWNKWAAPLAVIVGGLLILIIGINLLRGKLRFRSLVHPKDATVTPRVESASKANDPVDPEAATTTDMAKQVPAALNLSESSHKGNQKAETSL